MRIKSLKHNFIMYSLRIISGMLFLLLVFPFVARILGPANLGKIQFVESIIVYFLLFINLGIPSYGKREISFIRENKYKRSKLVLELLFIQGITTVIVSLIFFISINSISYLSDYKLLFYIFFIEIILNFLGVEWFYMGIEDQEYITKRKVFFQILSSIAIFLFLNNKDDYLKYAGIIVFSLMGSNILNFKKMFKYIYIDKKILKNMEIKKHLSPIIVLFTTSLATSVFSSLDSIMIRALIDERALGFYSVASKLGKMPIAITSAVFIVSYPRLCNLINKKEYDKYYELGNHSLDLSLLIATPLVIGMFVLAPEIIQLIAGSEFNEAIVVFRVFSILVIVMAFAVFTGNNLVINLKEKIFMKGQIIASISNVIFNLVFIPILGALGAALGTVIAETISIAYRLIKGREIFSKFSFVDRNKFKILISSLFMGIIVYEINVNVSLKIYLKLGLLITSGGVFYLIFLIILKEKNIYNYFKMLKLK